MSAVTKAGKPRRRVTRNAPLIDRLTLHRKIAKSGCWEWQGAIKNSGYGCMTFEGKVQYTHRLSYMHFVGPIPADKQIDHLCRNRTCFNPEHLEAVTAQVNTRRGTSPGAKAIRRHGCKRGHDRSIWGYEYGTRVFCRLCRVAYLRVYAERRRAGITGLPIDLDAIFNSPMMMRRYELTDITPADIRDNGRGRTKSKPARRQAA